MTGPIEPTTTNPTAPPQAPAAQPAPPAAAPQPPAPPVPPAQPAAPQGAAPKLPAGVPEGVDPDSAEGQRAQAEFWRAQSRKLESDGRENAKKAKAFDEAKQAQMTELERAQAAAKAAEERAQAAELSQVRTSIIGELGLAPEFAPFITGQTAQDVQENARQLDTLVQSAQDFVLELYGVKKKGEPAPPPAGYTPTVPSRGDGRPMESLRPGNLPGNPATNPSNANTWLRQQAESGSLR